MQISRIYIYSKNIKIQNGNDLIDNIQTSKGTGTKQFHS